MSSYFNLTLDTLAPDSPSIIIEGGAAYTSAQLVNCGISTADRRYNWLPNEDLGKR